MIWWERTRSDLELDVIVAAMTIDRFRRRVKHELQAEDFWVSDHRALFTALPSLRSADWDPDEWFARTVGCTVPEALERRLSASPIDYAADLALLVNSRC